jgi:chromosome partitioning protein
LSNHLSSDKPLSLREQSLEVVFEQVIDKAMIIAFVNQKGGVGKTCVAVHFALWLQKKRKKVCVVDADKQKSALTWLNSIDPDFPVSCIIDPNEIIEQVPDKADGYDFLIIDAPGKIEEITRAILLISDLAVIPCQPAGLDLHSSDEAFRLARQARQIRGNLPSAVSLLSRTFPGTKLTQEAKHVLSDIDGITLLKNAINQRQIIADCFGQESSVWELKGSAAKKSATEYESLFNEILRVAR